MPPFPQPKLGQPALVLAPMEGVTDAPMRAVQSELGAFAYCVSEFLRISGSDLPARVFLRHVPELRNGGKTPSGVPVQVQLLGGNAERLATAARTAYELGAGAIDLNFGCPAPTVNAHDGGATLLKYPNRIREIVSTVRAALPASVPVSAKLRLGWDSLDPIFENARQAVEAGASWITIHGRTRNAGYNPPIFWEPIGEVRRQIHPIPVIANGDIWTLADFRRCREITGCEHFMMGRGAMADPHLALGAAAELGIVQSSTPPFGADPKAWLTLFEKFARHTEPSAQQSQVLARRIKQWTSMAARFGKVDWFENIKRLPTFESISDTLASTR